MIDKKLRDEIWNTYTEEEHLWSHTQVALDYDHCACINVIGVNPKDAKTLDDVESFTVSEDISGMEIIECVRKLHEKSEKERIIGNNKNSYRGL